MKTKILYLFSAFIFLSNFAIAQNNEELWTKGNMAFQTNDYKKAIDNYNQILNSGVGSSKLYYNLANSYYKDKQLGKAILNYKKAERLAPLDENIKHNLALSKAQTKDNIEPLPRFFLGRWIDNLGNIFSTNQWASISLYFIGVTLLFAFIFIFSPKAIQRKLFFSFSCLFFVLFIVSVSYSVKQKNILTSSGEAIVMENYVAVKSSPDNNSKDLFVLNEGSEVKVLETLGTWSNIEIASGNRGWIISNSIESIDIIKK